MKTHKEMQAWVDSMRKEQKEDGLSYWLGQHDPRYIRQETERQRVARESNAHLKGSVCRWLRRLL